MTHFIYKNELGHEHAGIILATLSRQKTNKISLTGSKRQYKCS